MAQTTIQLIRRLVIAAMLGASVAAGLTATITTASTSATDATATATSTSTSTRDSAATSTTGGVPWRTGSAATSGKAGDAAVPGAHASGIDMIGAGHATANPTVSATTGTRLATEARIELPGGLATVNGVSVSAAVVRGHTAAHATIAGASYGGHDLGPIAVHCRDGKPTSQRRGIVRLAPNKLVEYGRIQGNRAVGATVLVLGPADRVIRMITIATASCTAPGATAGSTPSSGTTYAPRTVPDVPAPTSPTTTASGAGTTSEAPSDEGTVSPGSSRATEQPGASGQRRLLPRAPAPTLRHAHLQVTG